MHHEETPVPVIKIPHNTDSLCIWSPHGKVSSLNTVHRHKMCAQLFICLIIYTCTESLFLFRQNLSGILIRILPLLFTVFPLYKKAVFWNPFCRQKHCEISRLVFHFHLIFFFSCDYLDTFCLRKKSLDQNTVLCNLGSHHIFRRNFFSIYYCFDPRPVHILI